MRKSKVVRPFAPDYVSADTLAYRLDCAVSTVREYVDQGLLPQPTTIGSLVRWRWSEVEAHIRARFGDGEELQPATPDDRLDPFSRAVLSNG